MTSLMLALVQVVGSAGSGSIASDVAPIPLDPANWIRAEDFPVEAIRANASGTVSVDLSVDKQGRVTACGVVESSGSSVLDVQTCALLRGRATFRVVDEAAFDVPVHVRRTVTWVLPAGPSVGGHLVKVRFDRSAPLTVKCIVEEPSGEQAMPEPACAAFIRVTLDNGGSLDEPAYLKAVPAAPN